MSYPKIYDDGDWTVAQPDGDFVSDRPFAGQDDPTHQVILWPHVQARANYSPLALDTPHPTIANAYLTNELGFQDIGGGIMRWFREYSTIPATRRRPSGTEAFQFPGLPTTAASPVRREVTAGVFSGGNTLTLTTDEPHGLTAGDLVFFSIQFTWGSGPFPARSTISDTTDCLAGTTGSTIVIGYRYIGFTPLFVTIGFSPFILEGLFPGRNAFTRSVPTVTDFEYFLPGVTSGITTSLDVRPESPFRGVDQTSGLSSNNLISAQANAYRNLVLAGSFLTSDSQVSTYKGNILVRATRRVLAI